MKKEKIEHFFSIWFALLLLNQVFIYGCFAPYCIIAGMPHTGIIAFLFTKFFYDDIQEIENQKNTAFLILIDLFEKSLSS